MDYLFPRNKAHILWLSLIYTDRSKSEITSKQLKEGGKKLQLQYSQDIINAYADKEQMILYAIEYIKKCPLRYF